MNGEVMKDIEYSPQTTAALIMAIPDNPYDKCPCGCGKKWKFVKSEVDGIEKHAKKFCDNYEKNLTCSTE